MLSRSLLVVTGTHPELLIVSLNKHKVTTVSLSYVTKFNEISLVSNYNNLVSSKRFIGNKGCIKLLYRLKENLVRNTTCSEQAVYSAIETTCFGLYWPSSGFYNIEEESINAVKTVRGVVDLEISISIP